LLAFLVAAALAGSLVGPSAAMSAPADASAQAGGFQLIGTHPQASQQPTERGKTLNFLEYWNGAIYAGYGDYGANTGPIAITPFALSTDQFAAQPALWANSEELEVFRALNGNLYAPSVDPTNRGDLRADDYSEAPPGGPWMGLDVVDATHVFDMASRTGSELWMVGSSGENAVAWRSLDGGATWSTALTVPPRNGGGGARFYFAGVHKNALYLQAIDYYGEHPTSAVFDGSGWSDGPDLFPQSTWGEGYATKQFDGQLVYLPHQLIPGRLRSFDGAEVTNTEQVFYNYSIDGDMLYGLGENGLIRKTTDLQHWTQLEAAAPQTARSIVVVSGDIYVGTSDSRIYELPKADLVEEAAQPGRQSRCNGHRATLVGTNGSDKLRGTKLVDVITGLGGNDKLSGLAGNDLICGGAGKDTLKGGEGNDKLYGEAGNDNLKGGPGKDTLKGGASKDKQVQ
jgi:Ca2+-binding RTX toxin-like protein